jgi:O-antigen biosynthesis protein
MTKLSIVIVNYNVRHFILKCLESINKAEKNNLDIEIIIVDNASIDGSVAAIKEKYPNIILIENKTNVGFAKANNQAFRIAKGEFILSLNPDTIIQEDSLVMSLQYIQSNNECGVLGVKMIDGSGAYLPESKRGLPTLWNSFCKFSGLTSLFPHNKFFCGYYMGHLSEDNICEVEVLCGAFMLFKSDVLHKLGGFDEDFFMYGEDIDLSLRIKKSGYKVVYLPTTRIIHFKGESSKKASFNYIKNFYNAMLIYVEKNYNGWNGQIMKLFIKTGIYLSAFASYIKNNILFNVQLFFDSFLLYFFIGILRNLWAKYYFHNLYYFNNKASIINDISFVLMTIGALWFFGHYDKNWKPKRMFTGIVFGTFISLLIFALLPTTLRSSRALIIMDSLLALAVVYFSKIVRVKIIHLFTKSKPKNYLIVASEQTAIKIGGLIRQNENDAIIVGAIAPFIDALNGNSFYINTLDKLAEVIKIMKIEYVVFSSDDMSLQNILDQMILPDKEVKYLITSGNNESVIGSSQNINKNLFYAESSFKLSHSFYLRLKRLFDVSTSVLFLVALPLILLLSKNRSKIFTNLGPVFFGSKSWVGYSDGHATSSLPFIKKGVFDISSLISDNDYYPLLKDTDTANIFYAKTYSLNMDIKIIFNNI